MIERPILFSTALVRAILDGRKTQTRRVVKLNDSGRVALGGFNWHLDDPDAVEACPYGQPGDRLWVRESHMSIDNRDGGRIIRYKAGGPDLVFSAGAGDEDWRGDSKWKPSIHMCRDYSRILLEITNVRVERVQEISEADAFAEGTTKSIVGHALDNLKYRAAFQTLWNSINAARGFGWDVNPWVWVITFRTKASS